MKDLLEAEDFVRAAVERHCHAKGYTESPGVNILAPHDAVAAFAMAELLIRSGFDHIVAVAPEGHIYGFFLERLGATVLSVYVDFPPTRCEAVDDLSSIRGGRVLVIEDDVAGGRTLRLVANHLESYGPRSLALYPGHLRWVQRLENVPANFTEVYLAEERLNPAERGRHVDAFIRHPW
jgi:hypothetical protein